jgi:hypothetical protein
MGASHKWADESQLIMHLYIEFPWTWEEYYAVIDEVFPMLQTKGTPVATVVEITKMGKFPPGNVLRHLDGIGKRMPENVFSSVMVGAPQVASVFLNMITRIQPQYKRYTGFAKTIEEAHTVIHREYQKRYPVVEVPVR